MGKRKLYVTLIIILIGQSVFAQKIWTLEECIQYAKDNNIQLKQQILDIEDAKLEIRQTKLNYLPSVGIGSEYNTTFGRVLDPTTYEFVENKIGSDVNLSASASIDVFSGMRNWYTKQRAEVNLKITGANIGKLINDLSLNITKAYLELLLTEENIKIAEQKIEILNSQKKRTLKLIEAQKNTKGDLLQIEAQIFEANSSLVQIQKRKNIAKLNLCQFLEIDDSNDFFIEKPAREYILPKFYDKNYNEISNNAQLLPEIQKSLFELRGADIDIHIAKAILYPTISIRTGYGSSFSNSRQRIKLGDDGKPLFNGNEIQYAKYTFGNQFKDNLSGHVTLSLSIPIFNFGKGKSQVTSYKISKRRSEYTFILKKKQLDIEIKQALINVNSALEQYHILVNNAEVTKEVFEYIEKKLNAGKTSYYDYVIALNNLTTSNIQLLLAKYECIFCDKIIDFYMCKPIKL